MDRISRLPDELLVKVLSFLPTKVAVSTSILSKRWEFLWMWLPKLEYDYDDYSEYEDQRLQRFIKLNMPLHKAPVIETLRLKFRKRYINGTSIQPEDIRLCVLFAVSRSVRELSLNLYSFSYEHTELPSNLYTCKSLVILKLTEEILVEVPRMACLPSLKTLHLRRVKYEDFESLNQLLSSCPVLEDLVVELYDYDYFETLSVTVPSLQRLTLEIYRAYFDSRRLEIKTPSLKFLKIKDNDNDDGNDNDDDNDSDSYSFYSEDMPKLEEAEIDSTYPNTEKFVRSITYVKRLSLCIRVNEEEALYPEGIFFNQLQHLKLTSCDSNWSKLLLRLLKDSPNLRGLEVHINDDDTGSCVDPPDFIPGCLLSSLETFKWINGSKKEIDLIKYILRNGRCLRAEKILFVLSCSPEEEDELKSVRQDLSLSFQIIRCFHLIQ